MIGLILRAGWSIVVVMFMIIWSFVFLIFSSDYPELKKQLRDSISHITEVLRLNDGNDS